MKPNNIEKIIDEFADEFILERKPEEKIAIRLLCYSFIVNASQNMYDRMEFYKYFGRRIGENERFR